MLNGGYGLAVRSRMWCGVHKDDSKWRSGQLSQRSRKMERSVYTFFVHRTLSTNYTCTSGNTSRAVPSSKSDWTLSHRRADNASTAKSAISYERNALSEIYKSKSEKTR